MSEIKKYICEVKFVSTFKIEVEADNLEMAKKKAIMLDGLALETPLGDTYLISINEEKDE